MISPRTALVVVVSVLVSSSAEGQASAQPRDREIVGHLGITAIECDCTFDDRDPSARDFRFRSNLIVLGVAPSGPSAGRIFVDDTIFDVDGIPLRTRTGGRAFANIRPGQRVTLGLRRRGRTFRVAVTAAGINANDPSGLGQYMPRAPENDYGDYPVPPAPRSPRSPRVPRAPEARTPTTPRPAVGPRPAEPATPAVPPSPASPDGWFGFSIRCNQCGWQRIGGEPTPRWESTTFPEIGIVASGGPADIAGLRTGDRITHIDGESILTPGGALKFGAVRPGQRLRITVSRNGSSLTRELTLSERPRPTSGRSSLRYTGRLHGVDVEVWSPAGATVKRDGDTMTINVGGSTILLKAK